MVGLGCVQVRILRILRQCQGNWRTTRDIVCIHKPKASYHKDRIKYQKIMVNTRQVLNSLADRELVDKDRGRVLVTRRVKYQGKPLQEIKSWMEVDIWRLKKANR